MWLAIFVLTIVGGLETVLAKNLPSFIKVCKRNDPKLGQCIIDNVELLRPRMKDGIPELFIPPLNPLEIAEASLNASDTFQASFKNIELFNADQFQLKSFDIDLSNYNITVHALFPSLRIKSLYSIKGRILILNLDGNGPADGNYTNVHATLSIHGESFQKNNQNFLKWHKEKLDISIEKMNLYLEKIFGDNEELNDQTNKVINQNIDQIVEELQPVIQQIVSSFIFGLINRLFAKYSIDELFPVS